MYRELGCWSVAMKLVRQDINRDECGEAGIADSNVSSHSEEPGFEYSQYDIFEVDSDKVSAACIRCV